MRQWINYQIKDLNQIKANIYKYCNKKQMYKQERNVLLIPRFHIRAKKATSKHPNTDRQPRHAPSLTRQGTCVTWPIKTPGGTGSESYAVPDERASPRILSRGHEPLHLGRRARCPVADPAREGLLGMATRGQTRARRALAAEARIPSNRHLPASSISPHLSN